MENKMFRFTGYKFAALVTLSAVTMLNPLSVYAHAHLQKSTPAKDSVVSTMPGEVVLHFSEQLETSMCKLTVKESRSGELVSTGAIAQEGTDGNSLKISLKNLKNAQAQYEVAWKAVSKDAHSMPGSYNFTFSPTAFGSSAQTPAK
jgi:methionine-rich copper-binding protein CopC